jgi:hypothetical protein
LVFRVREIGAMLQLMPIILVPFVAVIQTCRFFLSGSGELYEVKHRFHPKKIGVGLKMDGNKLETFPIEFLSVVRPNDVFTATK